MKYIQRGWGFHVGQNFDRAIADIPIEVTEEYASPGHLIGYIAGDPNSRVAFMRGQRIRVHVHKRAIVER